MLNNKFVIKMEEPNNSIYNYLTIQLQLFILKAQSQHFVIIFCKWL